jgi:hypothetical protein
MKFSWLLNGTEQAHHLVAAYLVVWAIQGGYALWMTWQWVKVKRASRISGQMNSSSREPF